MEVINLETREEAQELLDALKKVLSRYGFVSKADLYQLVGLTNTYEDEQRGWRNLDSVQIIGSGKLINFKLPAEESLTRDRRKAARLYHDGADGCTAERTEKGYVHVHRGTCPLNKEGSS